MPRLAVLLIAIALLTSSAVAQERPEPPQPKQPSVDVERLAEAVNELVLTEEARTLAQELAELRQRIAAAEARQRSRALVQRETAGARTKPEPRTRPKPSARPARSSPQPARSGVVVQAARTPPANRSIPTTKHIYRNPSIGLIKSYVLYGKRFNEWVDGTKSVQPAGTPIRRHVAKIPSPAPSSERTASKTPARTQARTPARTQPAKKAKRVLVSEKIRDGMLVRRYSDGTVHRQRAPVGARPRR